MNKGFSTTRLLIAILVILASCLVWVRTKSAYKRDVFFDSFNSEEIVKIVALNNDRQYEIDKKGDNWLLSEGNIPADKKKIDRILNVISTFKMDKLVSQNPDNQSLFKVGDDADRLTLYDKGGVVVDFFVGKSGPDMASTYIRRVGSNDVYLIGRRLAEIFFPSSFADLLVFKFEPDKLEKLDLLKNNKAVLLIERKDDQWVVGPDAGGEVDAVEVDNYLSLLASFEAIEATSSADKVLGNEELELKLTAGGRMQRLGIYGAKNGDNYYARLDDDKLLFVLSEYKVRQIDKKPTDFVKVSD